MSPPPAAALPPALPHPLTQLDKAQALGFEGIASCSDSATGAPQSPDTMVRPARRLGGPAGGQQSFIQPPFVLIPRQGLLRSLLRCWLLQLAGRHSPVRALRLLPHSISVPVYVSDVLGLASLARCGVPSVVGEWCVRPGFILIYCKMIYKIYIKSTKSI